MLECFKEGLYWRGIVHDLSKFRPSEFFPYMEHFHGKYAKAWRDKTGYYKPTDTGDSSFDRAWFFHQKRNDHHWQYWVLPEDIEGTKLLLMPDKVQREMVCDWKGAGRAQGTPDVVAWWDKNGSKLQLHPETRKWVNLKLKG